MKKFMKVLERLKEPSTLRGLIMLVGAAGFKVSPVIAPQLAVTCGGIYALINIFRKEK